MIVSTHATRQSELLIQAQVECVRRRSMKESGELLNRCIELDLDIDKLLFTQYLVLEGWIGS